MIKIDLHTHSTDSYDGGITAHQYTQILTNNPNHYLAITDHNQIDLALKLHQQHPDRIIPGEEILTDSGEIIGLYLQEYIPPHQTITQTIAQIKSQNALVYIPHPLDLHRHGLSLAHIQTHIHDIDIIEIYNSRSLPLLKHPDVTKLHQLIFNHHIPSSSASDAHTHSALFHSHTQLSQPPNHSNLKSLLTAAQHTQQPATLTHRLAPKLNQLTKAFKA